METIEFAIYVVMFVVGTWVAYRAFERAGNDDSGATFLWMLVILFGAGAAAYSGLLLAIGLS